GTTASRAPRIWNGSWARLEIFAIEASGRDFGLRRMRQVPCVVGIVARPVRHPIWLRRRGDALHEDAGGIGTPGEHPGTVDGIQLRLERAENLAAFADHPVVSVGDNVEDALIHFVDSLGDTTAGPGKKVRLRGAIFMRFAASESRALPRDALSWRQG